MAIQYKPTKHAKFFPDESLTEQEHTDSCNINLMIKNINNGKAVRTRHTGSFGVDDMNIDLMQVKIKKAELEEELSQVARETEFSEEELKAIPKEVQSKFKFKLKKKVDSKNQNSKTKAAKNDDDDSNDDDEQAASKVSKKPSQSNPS